MVSFCVWDKINAGQSQSSNEPFYLSQNVTFIFVGEGLFPLVFNLASRATITVNATCGERGQETYCRLVEHVRRRQNQQNIQCGICDARSPYPGERHPITNAIDGSNKWWQSPTLNNGAEYNWVTITLDLGQVSLI